MTRFIAQDTNLKTIMNLLRSKSKNVQFEAFHVFKVRFLVLSCRRRRRHCPTQVFVANPKKPPEIEAILLRNKAKLLTFLKTFLSDKEDELFVVRDHAHLWRRDGRLMHPYPPIDRTRSSF